MIERDPKGRILNTHFLNETHPNWKGNEAGKSAVHAWLNRKLGSPKKCEHCGTEEAKIFEWANLSGWYRREFSDFIRLCRRCHMTLDGRIKGIRWRKGISYAAITI